MSETNDGQKRLDEYNETELRVLLVQQYHHMKQAVEEATRRDWVVRIHFDRSDEGEIESDLQILLFRVLHQE